MTFSYNWLRELAEFKESPEKLAEILTLRAFEVETIKKVGRDRALDVKIPANRISDAGNHVGLAREIAAILGKNPKFEIRNSKQVQNSKFKIQNSIQTNIAKPELCPRYTAQVLEIKNAGASPRWMQDRLATCGFRPVNAVVDMTNYVMLELGQPLHAFDLDKLALTDADQNADQRGQILRKSASGPRESAVLTVREARQGETLTTLDGTPHTLPQGTIIIAAGEHVIDLAGIMGGENSAVSLSTRKVLLQAAVFDPVRIYKTSRALNFSSAASKIYSAGIDPHNALVALERAAVLLEQVAGAKRIGPPVDIYPQAAGPVSIFFRPEYANRMVGQGLAPIFYKTVLERLGFGVEKTGKNLIVEVPTIRRDIKIEEDLIEEIVRILGYEKIVSKMPEVALAPAKRNDELFWEEKVRDYLLGAGFTESLLYEFTGDRELAALTIDPEETVELENPTSPETKYLVPRILIKYLVSAAENMRHFGLVKIWGLGKSFKKVGGARIKNKKSVDEHKDLIMVAARGGGSGEEEFYWLKGVVDELLEAMGISGQWYDNIPEGRPPSTNRQSQRIFHPYRIAEIKVDTVKIGVIGEAHPAILKNIKSKARIVAAEINFEKLWKLARSEAEYLPVGKYPAVVRDIAVIVPFNTKTETVLNIIENIGGQLLVDADLFDYFQDEPMREAEEKSLAFHLIFQSPERTLKDEEVNKTVEKITKALEEKGWEVRK